MVNYDVIKYYNLPISLQIDTLLSAKLQPSIQLL